MFKPLSKVAAQEIAFKKGINQLKGEMARCKQQQKQPPATSLAIDSKVTQAHATFESILTGWGPSAGGLERILELELGDDGMMDHVVSRVPLCEQAIKACQQHVSN
jgi:hypothetical protein